MTSKIIPTDAVDSELLQACDLLSQTCDLVERLDGQNELLLLLLSEHAPIPQADKRRLLNIMILAAKRIVEATTSVEAVMEAANLTAIAAKALAAEAET